MKLHAYSALALLLAAPLAQADGLDINLNNNAAQISYATGAGLNLQGNAELHLGVLYNDRNNNFLDAGLVVKGEEDAVPGLMLGVGAKAVASTIADNQPAKLSATAVAIGVTAGYYLPTLKRIGVVADGYLSPKILTFGDAENFGQYSVRLEYEFVPQTLVYLGYRQIHFGIKAPNGPVDTVVDDSGFIGVRLNF